MTAIPTGTFIHYPLVRPFPLYRRGDLPMGVFILLLDPRYTSDRRIRALTVCPVPQLNDLLCERLRLRTSICTLRWRSSPTIYGGTAFLALPSRPPTR